MPIYIFLFFWGIYIYHIYFISGPFAAFTHPASVRSRAPPCASVSLRAPPCQGLRVPPCAACYCLCATASVPGNPLQGICQIYVAFKEYEGPFADSRFLFGFWWFSFFCCCLFAKNSPRELVPPGGRGLDQRQMHLHRQAPSGRVSH